MPLRFTCFCRTGTNYSGLTGTQPLWTVLPNLDQVLSWEMDSPWVYETSLIDKEHFCCCRNWNACSTRWASASSKSTAAASKSRASVRTTSDCRRSCCGTSTRPALSTSTTTTGATTSCPSPCSLLLFRFSFFFLQDLVTVFELLTSFRPLLSCF